MYIDIPVVEILKSGQQGNIDVNHSVDSFLQTLKLTMPIENHMREREKERIGFFIPAIFFSYAFASLTIIEYSIFGIKLEE